MPDIRQLLLASSQAQATKPEKPAQLPQQDIGHGSSSSLVRQGSTNLLCSWCTRSASILLQTMFERLNHAGNFWRGQLRDASVPNNESVWQPCIGALTTRYPSDTEPFEGLWFVVSRLGMGPKCSGREICNMHPQVLRCADTFQNSTACHKCNCVLRVLPIICTWPHGIMHGLFMLHIAIVPRLYVTLCVDHTHYPEACTACPLNEQVASHPHSLPEHPALQAGGASIPPLPMLLNFQQRFSQLLGLRRHCVVSVQLDGHGDLILSATASGKIALHDFTMFRECSNNIV